jgi:hypothetical protein
MGRHRRQPPDTGATQQPEHQGFGLVIAMLRGQQHLAFLHHAFKRSVARLASGLFEACAGPDLNIDDLESYTQNLTHLTAMPRPRRSNGLQAVMHMDSGQGRQGVLAGEIGQQVQQDGGIEPT